MSALNILKWSGPDANDSTADVSALPGYDFTGGKLYQPVCQTRRAGPQTTSEAHGPRTDHDLIVRLCQMPVDLAAPLLRSSLPSLDTAALLALIAATGEAHHVLIAQRPQLDWRVVRALMRGGHDSVLVALVHNPAADLDTDDRDHLERMAKDRPDLQRALSDRFRAPTTATETPLSDSHSNLKLLKLMRGGDTTGFVREAARRLRLDAETLKATLLSGSAVPLALVMCALGLDKAVFLYALPLWQAAHGGAPRLSARHRPVVLSVFAMTPQTAAEKLMAQTQPTPLLNG